MSMLGIFLSRMWGWGRSLVQNSPKQRVAKMELEGIRRQRNPCLSVIMDLPDQGSLLGVIGTSCPSSVSH